MTTVRFDHSKCDHPTSGAEGKKARAKCRKEHAEKAAKKAPAKTVKKATPRAAAKPSPRKAPSNDDLNV